ncbi:CAAX prenyl protease-related protein [Candidatus Woesearchaeota archaeon]|nr:CAAX prenyl protease-related protein [Candidatus Woesearchaeota archaeon]
MRAYVIPFFTYIISTFLFSYFFRDTIAFSLRYLLTLVVILYFWKNYKLKFKISNYSFFAGVVVFIFWVSLDDLYPRLAEPSFIPLSALAILIKYAGSILVAPLVEELFVRSFLLRYLIDSDNWKKTKPRFTWLSFAITVLFFGFSHSRWLAGLIAGIIYNLVYYKTKDISECVFAHATTNLFLGIYVIITQSWWFW